MLNYMLASVYECKLQHQLLKGFWTLSSPIISILHRTVGFAYILIDLCDQLQSAPLRFQNWVINDDRYCCRVDATYEINVYTFSPTYRV